MDTHHAMEKLFSHIRLLRPRDWIKNSFLFAPLFFTPHLFHLTEIGRVLLGACLFSLIASSIYILNDLKDHVGDRLHPIKQHRPIATALIPNH